MAETGWGHAFDDPIPLPSGGKLRSLRDAGEYVAALSKAEQGKQHWQIAAHELMMAAEHRGILSWRRSRCVKRSPMAGQHQHQHHGRRRPRNIGLSDDRAPAGGLDARNGFDHVRDWNDLDRSPGAGANLRSKLPYLSAELRIGGCKIECDYTSLAQCNASASGRAAQCYINPFFALAHQQASPGRGHRRRQRQE
jgi:hypothetical protein